MDGDPLLPVAPGGPRCSLAELGLADLVYHHQVLLEKYLLKSISLALSENLLAPGTLITPNSTKFIIRKIDTENGF